MKEITRIHIAKVAYDIELNAKKDIEKYIASLERYAEDPEILGDIEIRITELLGERGVEAGGVISADDVDAVRERLGEPSDFAGEDVDAKESVVEDMPRRIYRDMDMAVLGGVLAGVARYFGANVVVVRLLFIVFLLGSFGTALLLYVLLWLVIPPARTAAEKLQMSGRPVTLASIKELAGTDEQQGKNAQVVRQVLSGIAGSLLVLMAIAGLLAIVAVIFGVQFGFWHGGFTPMDDGWIFESWWFMAMMGLFIVSGLLFSALCFVLASAVFRRQWSRRIGVAVVAIIAAGLIVFAGGIGAGMYGYVTEENRISELHQNTSGDLPAGFMNIKKLTFDTELESTVPIQYIVSDKPHYELDAFPGVEPHFELASDGSSATVKLIATTNDYWRPLGFLRQSMTILRVYGPELDGVEVASGSPMASYENKDGQTKLAIMMRGSHFTLDGVYDSVSVAGNDFASVSLGGAAIGELNVEGSGRVTAGVVRLLNVKQPDVCAAHGASESEYFVRVQGVSGGKLIYNGKEEPAKTISNSCGKVIVGSENNTEREW